ncbi:type II secretion system minor pseudopilin GspI [Acinetobacter schindleri]|uniref:type II secretion system minor pseudopilin GspI n=1 Tax=Acinetobacter schindleri TaxID=108981 RepID=UPI002DB87E4C|nr:type II secretion system minor pseudopilin GspI [Acinetobacter schindleri]MEB5929956.1 type II secretion system minor pseudopilin GspI [Acinetobacter schindleri]
MKFKYFKQSAGAEAIKSFKASADRFHYVYLEHSSLSYTAVKQHYTHRSSSSTAFGLSCATMPLRSSVTRLNRASGFTLLEVMVALAIFATAAMALTKVAMQYTQSTSHAILRTKAQFVALNEAAQMEINQEWLTGTSSRQITQQGESWQIDKKSEPTISPNVQRVDIQVGIVNADTGQLESGVSSLVFFNHRVNQTQ